MTSSHALVCDLDGTIVDLPVDWNALRHRLGIRTMAELWKHNDIGAWDDVTDAEEAAARIGPLREIAVQWIALLGASLRVAIFTDNSRRAAEAVLARSALLSSRCVAIVGREELGGPKRDPLVFAAGLKRCLNAVGSSAECALYLGDADYELRLAEASGLQAVAVGSLLTSK